ncbi:MAG: LysR family transcriptional regulator [Firmicutes bacterium]|nr:LysR family transcriptional regulator [Bacillota bacterium]
MNLSLLQTFVTVVEMASLSGAARKLHLTQPAVSKHIQALEEHYGTQLLERVGRRIKLTEAGEILFRNSLEIMAIMEQTDQAIAESSAQIRGRLALGASNIPGHYILPAIVGRFKKAYPEAQITLEIGDTSQIISQLLEGKINVGVVGAWVKNRKLTGTKFAEDEICLIVPPDHPRAKDGAIEIKDLLKENLIWREKGSGTRMVIEEKLNQAGLSPEKLKIVLELGSTEAVISAVEAGLGAALVSRWATQKVEDLGRVVSLSVKNLDLKRDLYLVYPKQKSYPRVVQAFLDFVRE